MSTRATYQIKANKNTLYDRDVTVYIHHDGYEEGGAMYLWAALHAENQHGSFAERFIRGNERAELTGGHETHGDTEYRYTVMPNGHDATARLIVQSGYGEGWAVVYDGTLHEFITKHPDLIEGFEGFVTVGPEPYCKEGRLTTPQTVRREIARCVAELKRLADAGCGVENPNVTGNKARIERLHAAIGAPVLSVV